MKIQQKISANNNKRMSADDLLQFILQTNDVFDFFTLLANYVKENDGACTHYISWVNASSSNEAIHRISSGMSMLRYEVSKSDARLFAEFWYSIANNRKKELPLLCLYTLSIFDNQEPELIEEKGQVYVIGPLSTENNPTNMVLYPQPPVSYQQEHFQCRKMHEGRNTIKCNPSDALSSLKRYSFISKSELGHYQTNILRYNPYFEFSENDLVTAVSSIRNKQWFSVNLDHDNKTFTCTYDDPILNQIINENICKVIDAAAEKGVHILAFPEMIMNPETEDYVKNHLYSHPRISTNVLLIALGTVWNDYRNEGCLLSGSGTELWRGKKRIRYDYFDKNTQQSYCEDLQDIDGSLNMLDIPGIGRICWEICRDCLAQEVDIAYQRLEANFYIISAFSSSLAEMINRAKTYSLQNGAITLAANYCHCSEEKKEAQRGFIYIPKINGKLLADMQPPYCQSKRCNTMDCDHELCAWKCIIHKDLGYTFDELSCCKK